MPKAPRLIYRGLSDRLPLTPRGWLFTAAGLVLLLTSRVIGVVELAVLAGAAFAAVVAAVIRVRSRSVAFEATRSLQPDRVGAGAGKAVARLRVTNSGRKGTPVVTATDTIAFSNVARIGGSAPTAARFLVPPLRPHTSAGERYELPTERRGIFRVGPLQVAVTDALGLAEAVRTVLGEDRLVVYPKITEVYPLLGASRIGVRLGNQKPVRAPVGTDFHGLREYEVGDDLRRVHWPSTARTEQLMLRQDEISWESETTTVLFDTRRPLYTADSFEMAVEAAASVVTALSKGRNRLRFLTTDGFEGRTVATAGGHDRYFALMEFLAGVEPTPPGRFESMVESLRRKGGTGPLAVITGDLAPGDAGLLGGLTSRFSTMVVVNVRRSDHVSDIGAAVPGAVNVPASKDIPFALGWDQAVMRCARSVPAPS